MTAEAPQPIELRDRIIELRRVKRGEVLPNPKNFRRHPDTQRETLKRMLATVGIAGAALAYKSERAGGALVYIDGHLRDEEVAENLPVLITDLDDGEADLLLAGYDHLSAMAESDDKALAALLSEIAEQDKDSLSATGYDDAGLKALLERVKADEPKQQETEGKAAELVDRAAELQEKWNVQRGQIWRVGNHFLMCGDSTDYDDVSRLMDGRTASLLVTDPPYNVGKDYGDDKDDSKELAEYESFSRAWLAAWQAVSERQIVTPGGVNHVYWARWFESKHVGVWIKTNALSRGRVSNSWCWEPVFFFGEKWKRSRANDVFDFPISQQSGVANHPCPKPLKMWSDLIENYSEEGHLIADAFCGSGTAIVAAEQLNRIGVAMDKEEKWIAASLERLSLLSLTPQLVSQ